MRLFWCINVLGYEERTKQKENYFLSEKTKVDMVLKIMHLISLNLWVFPPANQDDNQRVMSEQGDDFSQRWKRQVDHQDKQGVTCEGDILNSSLKSIPSLIALKWQR